MNVSTAIRVGVATLLATGGFAVIGIGPAQAATPHCSDGNIEYWGRVNNDEVDVEMPVGGGTSACLLSQAHDSGYRYATYLVQDALDRCYGLGTGGDGYYGSQTTAAVKSFQKSHGLTADGVYGPATAKKLYQRLFYAATARHHDPGTSVGCGSVATLVGNP